ncbi:MAG: MBL fold metallo-hydrolase [Bacteroidales bacterium]|nr:MBL fold metallo-hydrolase [Bacteroidales bacterium]
MIELCALASGSNGNCYYIGNRHEAVLIDAGISARRIISRMHQQNLDPEKVKAVFISHEHYDHTSGARVLSKRLKIPVYLTAKTYAAMYSVHRPDAPGFFEPGSEVSTGSFIIHPFLKNHDAAEPCSFRIEYNGFNTGVLTDIGSSSDQVVHHLNRCHALFLETNYDEKMLWEGSYPWLLKQRIASERGHLSNDQAFELLENHSGSQLQMVFLSHLSAANNTPEKAMNRFREMVNKYKILPTSRYAPGEVFTIA